MKRKEENISLGIQEAKKQGFITTIFIKILGYYLSGDQIIFKKKYATEYRTVLKDPIDQGLRIKLQSVAPPGTINSEPGGLNPFCSPRSS